MLMSHNAMAFKNIHHRVNLIARIPPQVNGIAKKKQFYHHGSSFIHKGNKLPKKYKLYKVIS